MKHTPGPWNISDYQENQVQITDSTGTRTLAVLDKVDAQYQSNAQLISAAPDLLDALIDAQAYLLEYRENHDCKETEMLYQKNEALIKRVLGEEYE